MKPVFLHYNPDTKQYLVTTVAHFDWKSTSTRWMSDFNFGSGAMIPSIVVVDKVVTFEFYTEAIKEVARLYALQLLESL